MDNPQPSSAKILIIEDEHFISELYVRALTKAGYKVDVIIDGKEALHAAQSDKYDIILLDIMIPTITGTELLKRLRDPEISRPIHSKIIITTNLEQSEEGRAELEKQADGYIVKAEITPHELVDFISQIKL